MRIQQHFQVGSSWSRVHFNDMWVMLIKVCCHSSSWKMRWPNGLVRWTPDRAVRVRSRGRGHCVVFLGKTLHSHSASLNPGVHGYWRQNGGRTIVASCYRNWDKLWQLWATRLVKTSPSYKSNLSELGFFF